MIAHAITSTADAMFMRFTMLIRSTVAGALTTVEAEDMIVLLRVTKRLRTCNRKIGQTYKNVRVFERFD
jgi:hypothetical protein